MAFTYRFAFVDEDGYSRFGEFDVDTLAEAKRAFYANHRHAIAHGGIKWVAFAEVVEPLTAFEICGGKRRRCARSFHRFA